MGFLKDVFKNPVRAGAALATLGGSEGLIAGYDFGKKQGFLPDFGGDQGSFNQQVGKGLSADKKKNPTAPDRGMATGFANNQISEDLRRRQGSRTLFTSGQGLLNAPLIASAILLGS